MKFKTSPASIGIAASLFVLSANVATAYGDGYFDNIYAGVDSNSYGKVEVKLGGIILGKGTFSLSPTLPSGSPYQDSGTRMLWHPRKAAFRAGFVNSSQWNELSIGAYSAAFGYNVTASGEASFAGGAFCSASGGNAVALGSWANASGDASVALNYGTASGYFSLAVGASTADGEGAVALGTAYAYGDYSVALGNGQADGMFSSALGTGTFAESYISTAIGSMNIGGGDPDSWVATDPLFEIGNANPDAPVPTPSNAVTVYKNGNMDVQGAITCAPGGDIPMFGE